jgi:hypothetical protein
LTGTIPLNLSAAKAFAFPPGKNPGFSGIALDNGYDKL